MSLKKPREAIRQVTTTLAIIIVPLTDAIPHKIRTFAIGEKIVEEILPTCTKWKDILLDINAVGNKPDLEPILLSKLSAIKKASCSEYIIKIRGNKFARCSNCEKLKRLRDVGYRILCCISIELFQACEMQETHRNDYYTNRALSISMPLEVLTVIHDKMDHAKTTSPCFANRIKAMDGFFKLPILITNEFGNNFIAYFKCNFVLSMLYLEI